jgi:hypothetical protein
MQIAVGVKSFVGKLFGRGGDKSQDGGRGK